MLHINAELYLHLQSLRLLCADPDFRDAVVPWNNQNVFWISTLWLHLLKRRKSDNIVSPVPLQNTHNPAYRKERRESKNNHNLYNYPSTARSKILLQHWNFGNVVIWTWKLPGRRKMKNTFFSIQLSLKHTKPFVINNKSIFTRLLDTSVCVNPFISLHVYQSIFTFCSECSRSIVIIIYSWLPVGIGWLCVSSSGCSSPWPSFSAIVLPFHSLRGNSSMTTTSPCTARLRCFAPFISTSLFSSKNKWSYRQNQR